MLPAWSLSSRWKHFSGSSEERRRRLRRRFPLEGVALEVMGMLCLWCFGFVGVGSLEDWSKNKKLSLLFLWRSGSIFLFASYFPQYEV
jgi:hypothetical protein